MITENDLREAIAECQGQRNPNANTCIKLASLYTILDHVKKGEDTQMAKMVNVSPRSFATGKISYNGRSEFGQVVNGKEVNAVLSVMDELMSTLEEMIPKLYNGVLNRLNSKNLE